MEKGAGFLLPALVFFEGKSKEIKERDDSVKTTSVRETLKHPLKVANVVVHLNLTRMLAPIFALVPVVHFLFPSSMSWCLDMVLRLAWAPMGWSSPSSRLAPLPGGGRKGLSLFWRLDRFRRSLRHCLNSGTATTVTKSRPLVSGGTLGRRRVTS